MSDSESDASDDVTTEKRVRHLRNVLFKRKPKKQSRVHTLAVEAQHLTDDAKAFVSRIADGLTVEVPKELQQMRLPDDVSRELDTADHQQFLRDQTCIAIQDRQREIEETQHRLEYALQELAMTKREEEENLQQKVIECQQEYLDSMTRLQEQRLVVGKADDLKMATMTQLAQYRSQCETSVASKAKALCATLATDARSLSPSPRSPRSARSSPAATISFANSSLLHSKLEGLHRKVVEESQHSSPDTSLRKKKQNKDSKTFPSRLGDRRTDLRSSFTGSIDAPTGTRRTGVMFPSGASHVIDKVSRHPSGSRRSFLELVESEDDA